MYYRSTDKKKTVSNRRTLWLTMAVCILCWSVGFFSAPDNPAGHGSAVIPLWDTVAGLFNNRLLSYLPSLLLFTVGAFIMQRISDSELLIGERTRLPFMIFMLLISTNGNLFSFSEIAVVLLCLVGVMYELFVSYHVPEATGRFYNAGFFIGVAGLLLPPVLWFIPLLWIGMYRFRSLDIKSFAASLTGIMMVYWFVMGWCVWKHDFSIFARLYAALTDFNIFPFASLFRYYQIGFLGVILILLMSFFHVQMDAMNNRVREANACLSIHHVGLGLVSHLFIRPIYGCAFGRSVFIFLDFSRLYD